MYIICLTMRKKKEGLVPDEYEFHSDYSAVDTLEKASFVYKDILKRDDLYSATICKPIESTEAHYLKETNESK